MLASITDFMHAYFGWIIIFFVLSMLFILENYSQSLNQLGDYIINHTNFLHRIFNDTVTYGYSSHNGPATWKLCFPESNGKNQSPINIDTVNCLVVNPCSTLEAKNWESFPLNMTLENNGNTVIVTGDWRANCYPSITGGPLGDAVYKFNCISFRWGPNDDEGSEHTIDNNRFSMEVQIINMRVKTNTDNGCFQNNNVAIISYFYKVSRVDNPYLDFIVHDLHKIKKPSSQTWIQPFPLKWLNNTNSSYYYAYNGSLTYPPCSESVTWIIFPKVVSISAKQIEQFRELQNSYTDRMLTNTRPVQLLNSRCVFFYD